MKKNYVKDLRQKVGHQEIILNCSAIWVENERGVLLERRGDDGCWGLIGGVMELGEGPKEAALREFKEETAENVSLGELIGVYSKYRHTYPSGDKAQLVVFFFEGRVAEGVSFELSDESLELKYFPRNAVPELGMAQHRLMMKHALTGKRNFIE